MAVMMKQRNKLGSGCEPSILDQLEAAGLTQGDGRGPWTPPKRRRRVANAPAPAPERPRKRRGRPPKPVGYPKRRFDNRATGRLARAVIEALADGPMTSAELRKRTNIAHGSLQPCLRDLCRGGLVAKIDTFAAEPTRWRPPWWKWPPGFCRFNYTLTTAGQTRALAL